MTPPPSPKRFKIYTKTGDKGLTGLAGGARVSKSHPRIAAYGDLDETNSVVGVAMSALQKKGTDLARMLSRIQEDLLVIGSDLASRKDHPRTQRIQPEDTLRLEGWIDRLEAKLPPLKRFILPGGCPAAAFLHLARTVCRRAERRVVELAEKENAGPETVRYLNRLSDLFFVMARIANKQARIKEIEWIPEKEGDRR